MGHGVAHSGPYLHDTNAHQQLQQLLQQPLHLGTHGGLYLKLVTCLKV